MCTASLEMQWDWERWDRRSLGPCTFKADVNPTKHDLDGILKIFKSISRYKSLIFCLLVYTQVISAINSSTIQNSHFSSRRRTSFIIHGFSSTGKKGWVVEMCLVWDSILSFLSLVVFTFCHCDLDTKVHLLFWNSLNSSGFQQRNYYPKSKCSHSGWCCTVKASWSSLALCYSREFSSPKLYKWDQSNKLKADVLSLYTGVTIRLDRSIHCVSYWEPLNHLSARPF